MKNSGNLNTAVCKSKVLSVSLIVVLTVAAALVNLNSFMWYSTPSPLGIIISALLTAAWILSACVFSVYQNNNSYLKFTLIYWGINLVFSVIGYLLLDSAADHLAWIFLITPILQFHLPFSGIFYLIPRMSSFSIYSILAALIFPAILAAVFFISKRINNRKA